MVHEPLATPRVAESAQSTWQALLDGSQDAVMVVRVRRDDMGKRLGYEVTEPISKHNSGLRKGSESRWQGFG